MQASSVGARWTRTDRVMAVDQNELAHSVLVVCVDLGINFNWGNIPVYIGFLKTVIVFSVTTRKPVVPIIRLA